MMNGTAVLEVEHRIGDRFALIVGDQHALNTSADWTLVGLIGMEQAVHDGRAASIGHEFRLVADQAACRRMEYEANAVGAGRAQFDHLALALGHFLDNRAGIFLVNVDDDFLDRLELVGRFRLSA